MRNSLDTSILSTEWVSQHKIKLVQATIISGVLIVSGLLALVASQRQLTLFLGLLFGLGFVIVLIQWFPLGLLLIPFVSMFVSFNGPGGINATILIIALIMLLWILDMFVRQRRIQLVSSRTMLPIFIFIIISILAFGMGQLPWFPFGRRAPLDAQVGGLAIYIFSAIAFLLVANLIRDLRWLKRLTWLFLGIAGLYICARILPTSGLITNLYDIDAVSASMFWVWTVSLSASQAVFNRRLDMRWRLLLGCLALAAIYSTIIHSYTWRSGYIPPFFSLLVIVGFFFGRRLLLLVPLLPVVLLSARNYLTTVLLEERYSWITRLEAWKIVLEISKANPILGLGFANYYWHTAYISVLNFFVRFSSHNQYIDIIAQTGVVGLVCFFWIIWEVGRLGLSMRNRIPDGFAKAYVYGVLAGLVGTLVSGMFVDWILPFTYNIGLYGFRSSIFAWIFMGGLVSIEQIVRGQMNQKELI